MIPVKLFFLLSAVFIIQTQAQRHISINEDVIDIIKKLVPEIDILIQGFLKKIHGIINEANEDPEKFRLKTLEATRRAVDKIWDVLDGELARIRARGDNDLKHAIDCIEGSKPESKFLILQLYNETTKCIIPQATHLFRFSAEIINEIQEVRDEVFPIANRIQKCHGDELEEIVCISKIIEAVIDVLISKGLPALSDVEELVGDIARLARDVNPTCIHPNVAIYRDKSVDRLNRLVACIRS